jgi:hypothetical protein
MRVDKAKLAKLKAQYAEDQASAVLARLAKYERVLRKARQMYASSVAGDFEVSWETSPATFNHRRARFVKLRDARIF